VDGHGEGSPGQGTEEEDKGSQKARGDDERERRGRSTRSARSRSTSRSTRSKQLPPGGHARANSAGIRDTLYPACILGRDRLPCEPPLAMKRPMACLVSLPILPLTRETARGTRTDQQTGAKIRQRVERRALTRGRGEGRGEESSGGGAGRGNGNGGCAGDSSPSLLGS